jgi:hypothetical protein
MAPYELRWGIIATGESWRPLDGNGLSDLTNVFRAMLFYRRNLDTVHKGERWPRNTSICATLLTNLFIAVLQDLVLDPAA